MRTRPVILLAGPSLEAISGVTTHVLSLLRSPLQGQFDLEHFQVGSEGRDESALQRLARLLLSPLMLVLAILRRDAAVVHLNTSLNAKAFWRDAVYLLVAKLCGARVLLQKHGGTLAGFCGSSFWKNFLVDRILSLPEALVVLSRRELEEYRQRLPRQHVVLLPNGIDLYPFRRAAPRERHGPLRLIYVGRLAPRKGLLEILDAMALLHGRGVAATLVIAGSGPDAERLRDRADTLGLGDRVSFAGAAHGERKASLMAQADVLLLPSYSEGLPYALLEGMAAGAVPVVTPVGAIPDVVERCRHGLYVPVGDADAIACAVADLAADRAALARMGAASRQRIVARYSIDRLAADFAQLYAALVPARAPKTVL